VEEIAAYGCPDLAAVIGETLAELVACDCAVVWYVFKYCGGLGAEAEASAVYSHLSCLPCKYW